MCFKMRLDGHASVGRLNEVCSKRCCVCMLPGFMSKYIPQTREQAARF